jgi:hypothetical protein
MSTENTPTHAASQRAIRLRLLASVLALAAGTAAVLIAVLYLKDVLG